MKRFLLATISALMFIVGTYGQNCTPDPSITSPGVYPEQPDTAQVGETYDFVFQILALKDTIVEFGGQQVNASIDSVKVNEIIGLPSSFSYSCEPSNCLYTHKAVGCLKLSSNPSNNEAGIHEIKIVTTAYASVGLLKLPVVDTADGYFLIVKGDGTASSFTLLNEPVQIYPNPSTSGRFTIESNEPTNVLSIVDLQGKRVDYQIVSVQNGAAIDLSKTANGVYFMSIAINDRIIVKKIIH